ncbi:FecR family protein [Trichocoleus sp. FACHB-262]|uniref:FecR family protein n=1 Tax=Trichocoleus sp. FACHB-262 TaxID=2692869 RepID=UPI001682B910|nr:FecR family protein [Trichocoleus sp. FACHB-262]MBD2122781.1 FecR domain-containing protein [Trichocoleus sp. FACHB-262]
MSQKLALFLALMLSGLTIGSFPQPADAKTPLTRAVIQALRNRVQLMQKSRPVRSARVSDAMAPGDALATARASLAELRFNDGSLARVGEQAVFRFVPNARTFQLSNGTMLLLIPPGRGPTGVRTPNAAAGIKGSALFVRYIPDTDTTLVGALTNNPQGPMVIYNRDASQSQGLRAGQLAVIVKNRIEQVYDFDLNTFYETSDLVKGLNLTQKDAASPSDEAIAAVRAETVEALQGQSSFKNANVIENPTFVRLPSESAGFPVNNLDRVFNSLDVRRTVEAGEVQSGQTAASPQQNSSGSSRVPPNPGATTPAAPSTSAQDPTPDNRPTINPPAQLGKPANPASRPDPVVSQPEPSVVIPPQTSGEGPSFPEEPPIVSQPEPSVVTPPQTSGEGPSFPEEPPIVSQPEPSVVTPPQTSGEAPSFPSPVGPEIQNPPNPPIMVDGIGTGGAVVIPIDPTLPAPFPGGGATGGQFPGGANGGQFPGQGPATPNPNPNAPGVEQPTNPETGKFPTEGETGKEFPGKANEGKFPGGGATGGEFPGRGPINK